MDNSEELEYFNLLYKCSESLPLLKKLADQQPDLEKKELATSKLKAFTEEYCKLESEMKKKLHCLKSVEEHFDAITEPNLEDSPEQFFENMVKEYVSTEDDNDLSRSKIWLSVYGTEPDIEEVQPSTSSGVYEVVSGSTHDSLMVLNEFNPPIDPICKSIITNPYQNVHCKHIYEYKSIMDYIQRDVVKQSRCPYMGCQNDRLTVEDLKADEELKAKIQEHLMNHPEIMDNEESDS